jgi:glutamate carboxypeptidase
MRNNMSDKPAHTAWNPKDLDSWITKLAAVEGRKATETERREIQSLADEATTRSSTNRIVALFERAAALTTAGVAGRSLRLDPARLRELAKRHAEIDEHGVSLAGRLEARAGVRAAVGRGQKGLVMNPSLQATLAQGPSIEGARALRAAIEADRPAIVGLLKELVEINSHTGNPDGVRRVGEIVTREMPAAFAHEVVTQPNAGPHHVFTHGTDARLPIVLVGHLDTVFPVDSPFQRFRDEGAVLAGPGTADMKGGVVVMLYALRLLAEARLLDDLSLVCIFNGDEETGSRTSRELYAGMQGRARTGLVFECGEPDGGLIVRRRGLRRFTVEATGVAAHAGNYDGPKRSAIQALAHMIVKIEALNRADRSVRVNVGTVSGGTSVNVVAARATCGVEMRFREDAAGNETGAALRAIVAAPAVEGVTATLREAPGRPPLQPTAGSAELRDRVGRVAQALGLPVSFGERGGVSDANELGAVGVPTLDALGPVGFDDHSDRERILTASLFDRIVLTAYLLADLGK